MVLKDFEKLLEPVSKGLVKDTIFGVHIDDFHLDGMYTAVNDYVRAFLADACKNTDETVLDLTAKTKLNSNAVSDTSAVFCGLYKPVPTLFWHNRECDKKLGTTSSYFYAHYNGTFFDVCVSYNNGMENKLTMKVVDYESIKDKDIYDYTSCASAWDLAETVTKDVKDLLETFARFTKESTYSYNKNRYVKVEERVKEVSEKYDEEFSLTKEETKAMYKWQREHAKKYHENMASGGGASPVSFFEVSYGCCSIGSWWNCECSRCMELYKAETDEKKKKKLYKQAVYEIRNDLG